MLDDAHKPPFAVTDLKQWVYCPRILYYHHCLPDIRPTTYAMQVGIEVGREEVRREERRALLRTYGITSGEREFNVRVESGRLGLRGEVDMVITTTGDQGGEVIPVDFKMSRRAGPHFKLQLAAYALMIEEEHGCTVRRSFLYYIPLRRAECIPIDRHLRRSLMTTLEVMRKMLDREEMPRPTPHVRKCAACEFRRFCNDVL